MTEPKTHVDPKPDHGKDAAAPGHNKDAATGKPPHPEKKIEPSPEAGDVHAADLREAAKAPHEKKTGKLTAGQKLRDGTVVNTDLPVTYQPTPDGNKIVGGPYDGKVL